MRYVDEKKLLKHLAGKLTETHQLSSVEAEILMSVSMWLEKQPLQPRLVGGVKAAELLGIEQPHFSLLRRRGQLELAEVVVEGGRPAYLRSDVEALARKRARARG